MLRSTAVALVVLVSVGSPALGFARGVGDALDRRQLTLPASMPQEVPNDAPASPDILRRRTISPAITIERGGFTSVQVNVDALGMDIIGDAANEPSMVIDPTNRNKIAIAWRQFDSILSDFRQAGNAFSTDGGQSWTFPGVLDPGQFRSDPVLTTDANGTFYFSSLSTVTTAEVFTSFDGGATWGPPTSAFGGDKQWLVADATSGIGSGNLYQIWNVQFSCCAASDFTRSVNGAASFQGPFALQQPSMKWGTMSVGPDGTLFFAGATLNQTGHLFGRSSNADNAAMNPTLDFVSNIDLGGRTATGGPNPSGLVGQVWVATDHSSGATAGNIYVLGSVNPPGTDPSDVMFIRSTDGGGTWSAPVRVNNDTPSPNAWQWMAAMSVGPNGRIDVTWNDTRNSGLVNVSEVFHTSSSDGGLTWEANVPITPSFNSFDGWPVQQKMGDYSQMISDATGVNLAYAATFNGEQNVFFVRIPFGDCDANGIPDADEIADGSAANCNGNDAPDACDIADGTSLDADGNGVPDECPCVVSPPALPEMLVNRQGAMVVAREGRFLTFSAGTPGRREAIRVTAIDLPPPFHVWNGTSMWVGEPFTASSRGFNLLIEPAFGADAGIVVAELQCTPFFTGWSAVGPIHVHHEFIIPSTVAPGGTSLLHATQYVVEVVDQTCSVLDANFSPGLGLSTTGWGDSVQLANGAFGAPDDVVGVSDLLALLAGFSGAGNAPLKTRIELFGYDGGVATAAVDGAIDLFDLLVLLAAFGGNGYPFSPGPTPCP